MKYINLSLITMIVTAFLMRVKELLFHSAKQELTPESITEAMWSEALKEVHVYRSMEIVLQFAKTGDDPNQTEIYNWVLGPCLGNKADALISSWCFINLTPENGYRISSVFNRLATPSRTKFVQWPMATLKQAALLNVYNRLMYAALDKDRNNT